MSPIAGPAPQRYHRALCRQRSAPASRRRRVGSRLSRPPIAAGCATPVPRHAEARYSPGSKTETSHPASPVCLSQASAPLRPAVSPSLSAVTRQGQARGAHERRPTRATRDSGRVARAPSSRVSSEPAGHAATGPSTAEGPARADPSSARFLVGGYRWPNGTVSWTPERVPICGWPLRLRVAGRSRCRRGGRASGRGRGRGQARRPGR